MTRSEFLNTLYRKLPGMSREEAEQYLTYYAEMLADRMEEGMTEEEAVASMEDVDAIAQRILQDRAAEAAAQPPQAPEVPAREASPEGAADAFSGSGDAPAPQGRRPWPRWALPAALAGVFLLLCFLSPGPIIQINNEGVKIGSFYCGPDGVRLGGLLTIDDDGIRLGGSGVEEREDAQIHVTEIVDFGLNVAEDTPADSSVIWVGGGAYMESGMYQVSALAVREIDIQWTAGQVVVTPGGSDNIEFWESFDQRIDAQNYLSYEIEDGKLTIQYTAREADNRDLEKDLTVCIPASLKGALEELDIETVSAEVYLEGIEAGKIDVETVSGACTLLGTGLCSEVDITTVSGDISAEGWESRVWDVETTDGVVSLSPASFPQKLDIETTSGWIDLLLPTDDSFALKWETVSGQLNTGYDDLAFDGKYYRHGSGGPTFEVETVSGDLTIS